MPILVMFNQTSNIFFTFLLGSGVLTPECWGRGIKNQSSFLVTSFTGSKVRKFSFKIISLLIVSM